MSWQNYLTRFFGTALSAVWFLGLHIGLSWAQAPHFRIGVLTPGRSYDPVVTGLKEGLMQLGYAEMKNVSYLMEDTKGDASNLAPRVNALLRGKPDLLFTVATSHSIAAKAGTSSVPVVFALVSDPLRAGLIASYASSKNNLTGIASQNAQLTGKRLELLKEIAPATKRILTVVQPNDVVARLGLEQLQRAAEKLRIEVVRRPATNREEIENVIAHSRRGAVDAIFHLSSSVISSHIDLLINKAKEDKIPLAATMVEMVERGALFNYGPDYHLIGGQAARLVAKILKGEKPSDIPTETPETLLLVLNRTTANAIGLKIPGAVIGRADRLVE